MVYGDSHAVGGRSCDRLDDAAALLAHRDGLSAIKLPNSQETEFQNQVVACECRYSLHSFVSTEVDGVEDSSHQQ